MGSFFLFICTEEEKNLAWSLGRSGTSASKHLSTACVGLCTEGVCTSLEHLALTRSDMQAIRKQLKLHPFKNLSAFSLVSSSMLEAGLEI